mgnify:CR=1 FL=1|tara:strand:+ start:388 stop:882 length:495 start_codon:yes stop_codon:yes gene_type:complete
MASSYDGNLQMSKMKPIVRALSVALFVTLTACGGGADVLHPVGMWQIDPDATLVANRAQIANQLATMPQAERAKAKEKFESLFKSMQGTIAVHADKTLVSITQMGTRQQMMRGSWKLDGNKITMTSRPNGSDVDSVVTGSVDRDSMTVHTVGTEQFVVLKKKAH